MRGFGDRFGEKSALIEADVAGWGTDEARDGVTFHVFAHVEADELDIEQSGELLCDLGFSDACRASEQV